MNLKNAFRLTKKYDDLFQYAMEHIVNPKHALSTTKTHYRNIVDKDAMDMQETIDEVIFFQSNDVISFATYLIDEKERLGKAISATKQSLSLDIDASIESNKYRQQLKRSIDVMLTYSANKKPERGVGYKFNAEGNQVSYYYELIVEQEELYKRDWVKLVSKAVIESADAISTEIDHQIINSFVDYKPLVARGVNDSFDDAFMAWSNCVAKMNEIVEDSVE